MGSHAAQQRDSFAPRGSNPYEDRFALVSVLQELTVAALELFDPRGAADHFLERLAERLGCFATALVGMSAAGRPTLEGASGLAPASRTVPITAGATELLTGTDGPHGLPYRELHGRELVCWRFPMLTPPGAVLMLFFEGEPRLSARYRGMLRRLSQIIERVLEHRNLFARSIESERRLDQKRTIIECLSESSPDGVLFIDSAGEVFFYNRRFVEMWDLGAGTDMRSRDSILQRLATKVDDREQFLAAVKAARADDGTDWHDEILLRDGRIFERQVRHVRSVQSVVYGYAIFYRDITERKRAEDERERLLETERAARAAAEDAIRARDDFLSIASHELRTPLTSLLLSTQQVVRGARARPGAVPETTLRALENSRRQAERLVRLVDGLLDVSRIQAGKLQLELEELDLAEVVREVVSRFHQQITDSQSQLVVHAEAPIVGTWDRSRIDQVATNLVANALKYGRGARIDVSVTADDEYARLLVCDRGIGIAPEQISRLFERFERAVSSRHYGGLGLGLFIVRQIVEMHGGTVTVESEPNVGSTFTVTLPRTPPRARVAALG